MTQPAPPPNPTASVDPRPRPGEIWTDRIDQSWFVVRDGRQLFLVGADPDIQHTGRPRVSWQEVHRGVVGPIRRIWPRAEESPHDTAPGDVVLFRCRFIDRWTGLMCGAAPTAVAITDGGAAAPVCPADARRIREAGGVVVTISVTDSGLAPTGSPTAAPVEAALRPASAGPVQVDPLGLRARLREPTQPTSPADRRAALIELAKPAHDEVCNCDPRYLMSCARMGAAILALAKQESRT